MLVSLRNASWIWDNYVLLQPVHTFADTKVGGHLSNMEALLISTDRKDLPPGAQWSSISKRPIKLYVTLLVHVLSAPRRERPLC